MTWPYNLGPMKRIVGHPWPRRLLITAALAGPSSAPRRRPTTSSRAFSAGGTNDAQVGFADFDLAVIPAGLGYVVDTCDQPAGTTYLRVFDEGGTEIAQGSGGCPGGVGTRLVVTAPATRRHHVRAGCAGDSSCSGRVTASSSVAVVERWTPVVFRTPGPESTSCRRLLTNFNFDGDYDGSHTSTTATNRESGGDVPRARLLLARRDLDA